MSDNHMINEINLMRKQMNLPVLTESEQLTIEINQLIQEGAWESIKYALSKLGRYKAGGKIFGKSQTDAKAIAQITTLLDKKGNEVIKNLDAAIKQKNVEFPNNKSQEDFLNTILEIAAVYDSIVAATKLKPTDKGYLPVDAANAIIDDLRVYTQKYLDVDLTAAFSVFNENEIHEESLDEANTDLKKQVNNKFSGTKATIKKGDLQAYGSERMKTLKSWRLPAALLGAGASFGALSWLVHYIFPAEKITTITPETVKEVSEKAFGNIKPNEGMTQIMNRVFGSNLSPNSNPNDVVKILTQMGGGDAQKGVEIITQQGGIFKDPAAAKETLSAIVSNPTEHGNTLKQVFSGTWAGTGKAAGDTLVTVTGGQLTSIIVKSVTKFITRTTVIQSAKAAIAAPILKTLGILLVSGAAVAALARYKGRKSSRAQILNDLLQYIRPVAGNQNNQEVIPSDGNKDTTNKVNTTTKKGVNNNDLYNNLKKYFQNIFNFKSQVNKSTYGQGGTSNTSKQYSGSERVASKLTKPNDIDDIIKLMEADSDLMRSITSKGNNVDTTNKGLEDIGLSGNEVKLFKTHIGQLTNLIKIFSRFNTDDKNLNNLLNQIKSNPILGIDINSLLKSDPKSLKIFVSDFNKSVYSTQFKNGNNIIDQLKKINVNKLDEAAVRTPSKSQANTVYNNRRLLLKNLPNLIKSFYAVFSYLIDLAKKGQLGQQSGNSQQSSGSQQSGNPQQSGNSQQSSGSQQSGNSQQSSGSQRRGKVDLDFKNEPWYLEEDYELLEIIQTHDELNQIIENVVLNEIKSNRNNSGKIFKQLYNIVPQLSIKIANEYKKNYNEPINRIKLSEFLQTIFGALASTDDAKIVQLISRADMDITAYRRMLRAIKAPKTTTQNKPKPRTINKAKPISKSPEFNPSKPETFLPDTVGNYNLSGVNGAARIALAQKASEIISKQTNIKLNSENMIEVMKQLIDDINKNGRKQIPTV